MIRLIFQRVTTAKLLIDNDNEWVSIGRGMIIYVAFLKGCSIENVEKAVRKTLKMKFPIDPETQQMSNIKDLKQDVLVIPQATLTGKLKSNTFQYYGALDKEEGRALYEKFVELLKESLRDTETEEVNSSTVQSGTYGNRQALEFSSEGPFSHMLEL